VAIAAGMALPAMAKAKDRAQTVACISNLRQIDLAKHQWATDKKKPAPAVPTWDDLQPYLGMGNGRIQCPKGGEYTIGPVSTSPTCSIPGHALPKTGQAPVATRRQ